MPLKRGAVAGAGRHADHRRGHEPADHRRERRVLAGHDDHAVRALAGPPAPAPAGGAPPRRRPRARRPACPAARRARAPRSPPARPTSRPTRSSPARAPPARRARPTRAAPARPPRRPARRARSAARASSSARVTSTLPAPLLEQRAGDRLDLLRRLALGEDRLRRALAQLAVGVHAREAEIAEGLHGVRLCHHRERTVSACCDRRTRATRERKSLDGLWRFAPRPGGAGRRRGLVERAAGRTRARCPCRPATTTSSPTPRVRDHVGDAWYQTRVRVPARLGRRADRAALRRGDPPRRRVGRRHAGRRARGRLHAVRGRRHRRSCEPGAEHRITVVVNNVLTLAVDPAGHRRGRRPTGRRQRYFHDFFNYAGLHRSVWLYTHAAGARQRRHRRHRPRRLDRAPSRYRGRGRAATARGARRAARRRAAPRSRAATGADGRADGRGRAPVAARRGLPVRARRRAAGRRRRAGRRYSLAGRHPHGRGRRHALPDQRRAVLLHAASASTRTARCAARATTTRSWSTTSR